LVTPDSAAPRFLDEREVRARLRMPELIDAMERALVEFSAGRIEQPVRTVFGFGTEQSLFGLMPSYVPSLPALGAKLVTVCPGNTARGLGTHQAVIVMLDPVTGVVEAILDGRYITEARTAAVSAVSARLLARRDTQVLGIVGSGVQARSHFEALSLVRQFREVRVWSPNVERRRQFVAQTGACATENAEATVRGADIVVAATGLPRRRSGASGWRMGRTSFRSAPACPLSESLIRSWWRVAGWWWIRGRQPFGNLAMSSWESPRAVGRRSTLPRSSGNYRFERVTMR
jgi:hypothetical protein